MEAASSVGAEALNTKGRVGENVGENVGEVEGTSVGVDDVGEVEGTSVGVDNVGAPVGEIVGDMVGDTVGLSVGVNDGIRVGDTVGAHCPVYVPYGNSNIGLYPLGMTRSELAPISCESMSSRPLYAGLASSGPEYTKKFGVNVSWGLTCTTDNPTSSVSTSV